MRVTWSPTLNVESVLEAWNYMDSVTLVDEGLVAGARPSPHVSASGITNVRVLCYIVHFCRSIKTL